MNQAFYTFKIKCSLYKQLKKQKDYPMHLDISKGLSHAELISPVGNFMKPVSTAFHEEMTIEEVLVILRKRTIEHVLRYFYSVDDDHKVTGVLSTRELLVADPSAKLSNLIDRNVLKINQLEKVEEGLKLMEKYGFQSIPVVDSENHLKGLFEVIPEHFPLTYDPTKLIQKVTSKDIYQLIGLSLHLGRLNSTLLEFRYRMPWLFCTLFAGLACATVIALFSDLLSQYIVLAMFLPLVLALGEAVSMQSMTLSLQFLHYEKIHWKKFIPRIVTEWKAAVLLGFSCAFLVGAFFWVWNTTFLAMLSVTLSIFGAMIVSTTLGSLIPLLLHAVSLDPKVASGPIVLMLTDIVAISIYLVLSKWLLTTFIA
jgi:magnesium transporter